MTDMQKNQIADYREHGYGYKKIGKLMGIPVNTIKAYCIRNGIEAGASEKAEQTEGQPETSQRHCEQCGNPIMQIPKQKRRRFCSDHCRNLWWNSHLDQVNRKANYEFVCACCGKTFTAYGNKNRKYCGRECYFTTRYGGGRDGNSGK